MRIELNLLNRIEFVRLRIELNAHHNWCVVMMSLATSKIYSNPLITAVSLIMR